MGRALFEIANEISADWQSPSPQAKTYLKGMCYLLGMDDHVADLGASTAVRMFLLYSKTWSGPVAERIKAELQQMRSSNAPSNAELLRNGAFASSKRNITHCEVCHASLGSPGKFVDGYTFWNARLCMCLHCNYYVSTGLYEGNGALYVAPREGTWIKLHGEPLAPALSTEADEPRVDCTPKYQLRFRLKLFSRKVVRKCVSIARRMTRRSA